MVLCNLGLARLLRLVLPGRVQHSLLVAPPLLHTLLVLSTHLGGLLLVNRLALLGERGPQQCNLLHDVSHDSVGAELGLHFFALGLSEEQVRRHGTLGLGLVRLGDLLLARLFLLLVRGHGHVVLLFGLGRLLQERLLRLCGQPLPLRSDYPDHGRRLALRVRRQQRLAHPLVVRRRVVVVRRFRPPGLVRVAVLGLSAHALARQGSLLLLRGRHSRAFWKLR
mmetsp:Transcript_211/g.762  ORF Transcript_211/g.762 Transcript_211/m.762 type:complete len:223 (-) Transcript_211:6-674(-)